VNSFGKAFAKLFVDEENVGCAKIKKWKNKNIDGFYTITPVSNFIDIFLKLY
jgi:nitrogen regulatory protein PII-like uncharacterized protein